MSELELVQRTNIKFLVKLGKSGNEIREMLVQLNVKVLVISVRTQLYNLQVFLFCH
jgi:hypothetical protein